MPKANIMLDRILFRSESLSCIIKGAGMSIIQISVEISIIAPAQKMP